MLNPVQEAVLLLALLAASACSRDGDAVPGGSESSANAFKNATVDNAMAAAGVTSILALSFDAPGDGFAWVSATGACSVVEPLPVASLLAAQLETTTTDRSPHAGDALFSLGGGGAEPSDGSFAVMRLLPATSGPNTVYLNVDNPSVGGKLYCSASMTALFGSHQLP